MGVMYPEPKYTVLDDDPSFWTSVQQFRTSDWVFTAQATAVTTVLGYYMGRPTYMHRPTALAAGLVGAGFGICYGLQNSMGRLMGLRENSTEIEASKAT